MNEANKTMARTHTNHHSGGQILVNTLENLGVTRIFSVPGESYLPVLDALYDSTIENTVCRQEGGAAMAAEAWGKITGKPGICIVTRGPGAMNASAGVHVAQQDSTPMILFVGQINSRARHREGFQELDYVAIFGSMAKWVAEIDTADRMEEMVTRAWSMAINGRPGPVVLALPENILQQTCATQLVEKDTTNPPWLRNLPIATYPCPQQVRAFYVLLQEAKKPLLIVGGSRWSTHAAWQLQAFAETHGIPVACVFRRQMLFNHSHPNYAGDLGLGANPALLNAVLDADVVVLLNTRFSEIPSQNFTLLNIPRPKQTLIHIHSSADELGKYYHAHLAIQADPISMMDALAHPLTSNTTISPARQQHVATCHQHYQQWSTLPTRAFPGNVSMSSIMATLAKQLPSNAIITNGAGNYASWIHRFWRFTEYATQLAPTSGSMGYGLPAAIAAKLAKPDRTVVCFAGDGCFQMTMQELGSAVQARANIIILLFDNGIYGTIRMHQERHFPGRESGTRMVNPNFAQLGAAYGIPTYTVATSTDFKPALQQALLANLPTLIHIHLDEQVITPTQTLDEIRDGK